MTRRNAFAVVVACLSAPALVGIRAATTPPPAAQSVDNSVAKPKDVPENPPKAGAKIPPDRTRAIPAIAGTDPAALFRRPAIIGASISDGFGLYHQVGAHVRLGDVLTASLRTAPAEITSRQTFVTFFNPPLVGREQVDAVLKADPTVVVALDFLFWYGYGKIDGGEEARLRRLEDGLRELDRLGCPILVGDFPDVSHALAGRPVMLKREQVPRPDTLAALNKRVAAWAAERPHVLVVPLGELVAGVLGGKGVTVRARTIGDGGRGRWLQGDLLHTSLEGTVLLWLHACEQLAAKRGAAADDWTDWDVDAICGRVRAARSPKPLKDVPPSPKPQAESGGRGR